MYQQLYTRDYANICHKKRKNKRYVFVWVRQSPNKDSVFKQYISNIYFLNPEV